MNPFSIQCHQRSAGGVSRQGTDAGMGQFWAVSVNRPPSAFTEADTPTGSVSVSGR